MNNLKKVFGIFFISVSALHANIYENCCSGGVRLAVDYLYWQAQVDQMQYATRIASGLPATGLLNISQAIIENPKFKAGSGVRGSIGWDFFCDWDVSAAWTHYRKCSSSSVSDPNFGIFAIPLFGLFDNDILFGTDAISKWCLKFDTVDLEIARSICACDSLLFRPFFGFKIARINQVQTATYFNTQVTFAGFTRRNNFFAVGPRVGINTNFYIPCTDVKLFANSAVSLLNGRLNYKITYDIVAQSNIPLPPPLPVTVANPQFIQNKKRIRPAFELSVGAGWEPCICGVSFDISAAYEVQYWWNQVQAIPSTIGSLVSFLSYGDLAVHGLTLRFGFRI